MERDFVRIEPIEIDLYQQAYFLIPLKQRDTTILPINVLARGEAYTVGNVILKAVRDDGNDITQRSNISVSGNTVEILLDEFVLRNAGEVELELIFLENNVRVSTYIFNGVIEPTQYASDMPPPDDVYIRTITVNDWALQLDGKYTISISRNIHNLSTTAYVDTVERLNNGLYEDITYMYDRALDGTITIITDVPYTGRLVLRR